ncbi:hypothetical protein BS78_03G224900 [Paspalum vaginatum]|nr:hypothetical protein BS78_03G224900 [Paspalum vaginatum]
MASSSTWRSSRSSASSARSAGEEAISSSPVAYRVRPLEYELAVYCKCKQKAARWISWSLDNPGRRLGDVITGSGHDGPTTRFLKELLIDMRDKIWALARDNADLRDSISKSRTELDEVVIQGRKVEQSLLLKLAEKDAQLAALGERVKRFEKERVVLLLAILTCVSVCVGILIR